LLRLFNDDYLSNQKTPNTVGAISLFIRCQFVEEIMQVLEFSMYGIDPVHFSMNLSGEVLHHRSSIWLDPKPMKIPS